LPPTLEGMPNEPPEIIFEHAPDALERKIRIGCGALLGLVAALFFILRWAYLSAGVAVVVVLLSVCVCAWLALRYGDEFWREMLKALRWF
jgi:Flp pilus assembly protein TadB